ncbi:Aste57867_5813 [Aphanomyces stellatus]|uniref:Aste57867_5813 protein n=1 Tax=Aphanomyces stellatus TaxID=120398 RepID=A0A485KHK4_9STRA|nr:hypothetical protein As57867_005799 [Aphanomyces stellatus]VFT82836.1 Aste57867_5813 [Aphanomyces stellatus]
MLAAAAAHDATCRLPPPLLSSPMAPSCAIPYRQEVVAQDPYIVVLHGPILSLDIANLLNTYRPRIDVSASRYSASMYLNWTTEPQIASIAARVVPTIESFFPDALVRIESVALTRYATGQSYGWHLDAYNMQTLESRALTFLVYLTDVPHGGGGETVFAHVASDGSRIAADSTLARACEASSRHTKVSPHAGRALLFRNVAGAVATHGSCVLHGPVKWIMQFWMSI